MTMHRSVRLRPWNISDVEALAANANNPNVWNCVRDHFPSPYTIRDAEEYIAIVAAGQGAATDMAIEVDGVVVGGVGIIPGRDVERITAEMGYWVAEKYWGRGIATAAVMQMSSYAFATFPIQKIYATVFDFNISSQKVLKKAGFVLEAVLHRAAIKNGQVIDMHYYSLFRDTLT